MLYSFGHVPATLLRRACALVRFAILKRHPTCCNRVAKSMQHVVHNNVAICCVEMLHTFGQLLHNISQHDPTMMRYVGLKCCELLPGA